MQLDNNLIEYPIATISEDWVLSFARSAKDLFQCNSRMVKNGYFNGLKIVDSSGAYYLIDNAVKTGPVGRFWGYDIFLDQKIYVDLIFSNTNDAISLKDFKLLILEVYKYHEDFWDSDGKLEERRTFVWNAKTHEEIINRLTEEFYKEYK